jgi:DNA repair photolyase
MKPDLEEYQVKKLVNVHKHVDGPWFWTRYSAKPYVGCAAGCPFCYLRSGVYLGKRDPQTFDTMIQAKLNAPALLRKELPKLRKDVVMCGDWQQPAERIYELSRRMLEVVLDLEFPIFVLERSVLVMRDIDLFAAINKKSWTGVAFSFVGADEVQRNAFEFRCPSVKARLQAMERLAQAGLTVGTVFMPIIPFIGDTQERLAAMIEATKDHGGTFVIAAGLTLGGAQSELTLRAALEVNPSIEPELRKLYQWRPGHAPAYSAPPTYHADLGRRVRELCSRYGIADRMPRYVAPGPRALNMKIAERLFLRTYDLELENAASSRIWAYRKAAWTIDDWPEDIGRIYSSSGEAGLRKIPEIGANLATHIGQWIKEILTVSPNLQTDSAPTLF